MQCSRDFATCRGLGARRRSTKPRPKHDQNPTFQTSFTAVTRHHQRRAPCRVQSDVSEPLIWSKAAPPVENGTRKTRE
ncbi:hypothetical protein PanWU01x14_285140 [Parasponia andersonii]|uniref:Uncharacterized protein n=1 Tax=Parasponia andersonii TaxID=3476 RepID=A0A2P5AZL4_PARAD|nr:hypothetical protein PanWU01x14_285140 [Parasponia andersonii]